MEFCSVYFLNIKDEASDTREDIKKIYYVSFKRILLTHNIYQQTLKFQRQGLVKFRL